MTNNIIKTMSQIDLAIITGAGRGIGRAIAIDIGKDNIPVLCISQSNSSNETKEEIIKNGGKAESLVLDIKDYDNTEKVIASWISKSNSKKLAVILVAGVLGPKGTLTNLLLKEWEECHRVNVLGNLAVLKALMPRMIENKFGRIITFAGGGSAYANPTFPAYSATKTAIVRITENINEDLKGKGDFAIVCLAPGAIETDMLKQYKSAGGEIKKMVDISQPVEFVKTFIHSKTCSFSGALVHVTNNWKDYLDTSKQFEGESKWKLRRIES